MKIAIICPNYPPAVFEGGISHYSRLIATHLLKNGHKVFAITSTEFTLPLSEQKRQDEIKQIHIQGPWNCNTVNYIEKLVKQKKIDNVVLQYSPASFKKSFRIKWALSNFSVQKIVTFHTLWGKGFDRILGALNLVGCKKIIATNSEIMSILTRRLPFLLKKTYMIPIGSNISANNQKPITNQDGVPIISYFGMLYPGKGLNLILDVLEVLKERKQKFVFKFIGGGMLNHEFYETNLQKKIKERSLDDQVEYLGRIPENEVSKWLNKSRFIFLPYERGLSDRRGSFMAAIAQGKAILSSPPVVVMPLLKNGVNVLWPIKASVEEYIKLTEKMLNDDELIRRLEKGAKELSSNFSWDKIAAEYEFALLN